MKDNRIVSTGYADTPTNIKCNIVSSCNRNKAKRKCSCKAEFFEECRVIHAEMNAILNTNFLKDIENSSLYLLGIDLSSQSIYQNAFPCSLCLRHIIKLKIKDINIFHKPGLTKKYLVKDLDYLGG